MWKYDQGIVATKNQPYTNFRQRLYHVRYRNTDNDLCRLISASFVYGIPTKTDDTEDTEHDDKFLLWLKESSTEDDDTDSEDDKTMEIIGNTFSKALLTMSKIITIMDFRLSEKNDIPTSVITKETEYELLDPEGGDKNNYLHLAHFEYYLPKCGVESCICTLTNDEEAARRVNEITYGRNIPE